MPVQNCTEASKWLHIVVNRLGPSWRGPRPLFRVVSKGACRGVLREGDHDRDRPVPVQLLATVQRNTVCHSQRRTWCKTPITNQQTLNKSKTPEGRIATFRVQGLVFFVFFDFSFFVFSCFSFFTVFLSCVSFHFVFACVSFLIFRRVLYIRVGLR